MKVQLFIKRIFDLLVSFIALVVLLPLILVLSFIVYFKLGWPIFFTQERPGIEGKLFKMIKFRSMLNTLDSTGNLLPDINRLTRFGRVLRSLSLDELPELINVFKGDMSLVGPRPLLTRYLPLYDDRQKRRHMMPPGMTGWAQVNGRNAISWEDKFKYDIWFVDNWSLLLDFKILLLTICKVFRREGINQKENLSSEIWPGNLRRAELNE